MYEIGSLLSDSQVKGLSSILKREGVRHAFELKRTDKGERFELLVLEEKDTEKAKRLFNVFEKEAKNTPSDPTIYAPGLNKRGTKKRRRFKRPTTMAVFLLALCVFVVGSIQKRQITVYEGRAGIELLTITPITRWMLFDAPLTFELIGQFQDEFSKSAGELKKDLSSKQESLRKQIASTPYWQGYYHKIMSALTSQPAPPVKNPTFTKIFQGEIWRLVTPCLLYRGVVHFAFNMCWLIAFGSLIERRIGGHRLLVIIGIAAVLSNVMQYLIGGPLFVGFSGVACAFAGFIFARKRKAPWEGYTVDVSILWLFCGYIGLRTALEILFFVLAVTGFGPMTFEIETTAHLAGALVGLGLGNMKSFAWKVQ